MWCVLFAELVAGPLDGRKLSVSGILNVEKQTKVYFVEK